MPETLVCRVLRSNSRSAPYASIPAALLAAVMLVAAVGCDRAKSGSGPSGAVSPNDISIHGMQLRRLGGGSYQAIGRLNNRSRQHVLHEVTLTFTLEDVNPDGGSSIIASTTIPLRYEVLPEASTYFQERISFGSLPRPGGRHEWNYSIASINGVGVPLPEREHSR